MTTTVLHRTLAPRTIGERVWTVLSAFLTRIGEIYDRKDEAKRSGLSWHYFSA